MKPNTNQNNAPRPLEVWNADMAFEGRAGSKNRPVVVLGKSGSTYDVMMSTTHPHAEYECMRPMDPYFAGLDNRSYIRTDKIYRLPASKFNGYIGELGDDDAAILEAKYKRLRS